MEPRPVVLDSNIIISAFGWPGNPRKIFDQILLGHYDLCMGKEQLAELARVVEYPRLKLSAQEKEGIIAIVKAVAKIVEAAVEINLVKEDPEDNMILEAAMEANAFCIVSGDEHLLTLKVFEGIPILTAKEFLEKYG
ncbi:putative toxin-antitoxin system toxin component, PIN family [Candidatus Woesearchaeota archaeon]|nr:putative toxin-antitoxin system toxin component, PIN family [Candidatus Woesearchaeota archaeon]